MNYLLKWNRIKWNKVAPFETALTGDFRNWGWIFFWHEQHTKSFARVAEIFRLGNVLVFLGSNATIFREKEAVCTYAYEYFALKKLLTLVPSYFLPHNTPYNMQSPFWVEIMRLRVVGETMIPQGTHSLLGNIFLVVAGTSRRVTTLSGRSDWPRCKRGDDLSCIFPNNTGSAAAAAATAAAVRLFALLRLWQF